jgi:hypothetical protein
VLDSANLEKLGVPSVTIVTAPFEPAARAVARSQGLPDLPLVIIPHDYLEEDDDRIRAKLTAVLDDIIEGLFGATAPRSVS